MQRKFLPLVATCTLAAITPSALADALVQYEFDNQAGPGGTASLSPTVIVEGLSAGDIAKSPLFGTGSFSTAAAAGTETNVNAGTVTNGVGTGTRTTGTFSEFSLNAAGVSTAPTADRYFSFTLSPTTGFAVDLTSISFDVARGNNSDNRGAELRYSFDGFATTMTIGRATITAGAQYAYSNFTFTLPDQFPGLQSTTSPIEFRFFTFANGSTQSVRFDNIIVNGTVATVPEPAAGIMALSGCALLVLRKRRVC